MLLAAFGLLLGRWAGSDDVAVGSPVAGRPRREVEELIGVFINTLVLRTDLSGDPDFRGLLRRVRAAALGAYEHQELPFERLVEALQPERSLAHSPLFQVMFVLDDGGPPPSLPGVATHLLDAELPGVKFDLSLSLSADGGGLRGWLAYASDLFAPATAARMARQLARVLEQVAGEAAPRLSRVELLDPGERARVLVEWNRTAAAYPAGRCIHHLVQEQAAHTPDAVALVCEEAALTYRELNGHANQLARRLRRLGVGPEARVGVCLPRGVELVIALLAVLKAGGAYVPLDPAYPAERLAFTLRDSGAAVLLTDGALAAALSVPDGVRVARVDAAAAEAAGESGEELDGGASARNLAYLIYTSGSTGVPKGVAIEHRSAVAFLAWAAEVFAADAREGVLAATSICFDLSVYELFLPLTRGGRVILVENALALPRSAARGQVRMINTVPSAITALLESGGIPDGVRTVNLAGEPLTPELVDALYARGGIERVHDLYGPSEDTTYSTFTLRRAGGPATIGVPIANTRAYVLDGEMRPLPPGVPGELYLAGLGLARGYLGRAALTANAFVPDPFGAEPGGRLYRTGDRVRWRETPGDGAVLEYLGRRDAQVKVRGFRIEPGEVEAALRSHPGVAECAVVARDDVPGEKRLVAYVAGPAGVEALRSHLRERLPEHMVPGAFVVLPSLPLTPNGKLDRRALPAPGRDPAAGSRPPAGELEHAVADAWRSVLARAEVGARDNFFDLGGSSLLLYRVFSRLRGLRDDLRMVDLFRYATVESLAAYLASAGPRDAAHLDRRRSRAEERRAAQRLRARAGGDLDSAVRE